MTRGRVRHKPDLSSTLSTGVEGQERKLVYLTLEAPCVGQASYVHVNEIVRGLTGHGWDVRLLQPSYTNGATKPGTLGRLLEYARLQIRLWGGLRRGEKIYLRSHFMAFPTALLAYLLRVPVINEVNGPYEDIFVTYPWLQRFRALLENMQRLQYRWSDLILPVTRELADWVRAEAGHSRVVVVTNGANTDLFRPDATPRQPRPEWPYAIFFGGLANWHGIDTMLRAAEHPEWPAQLRLVIIGNGQETPKVEAAAEKNKRVVFLGYKPYEEVPGWVASALCGLVPISDPGGRSQTGVLPLKLFETLACGIPAVVTDFPGQADLIPQGGCGVVIPPNDPVALVRAVAQLAADPVGAAAMGKRGAQMVISEHSWAHRAAQLSTLLECMDTRASR